MQDNCRLSGPGASQQLHLPKGWPCPGMVRMLPAAAGRSAQGNRSTPLHWDTGILLAPTAPGTGGSSRAGWILTAQMLPLQLGHLHHEHLCHLLHAHSTPVSGLLLQNAWKPFLLSPRSLYFSFWRENSCHTRASGRELSSASSTRYPEKMGLTRSVSSKAWFCHQAVHSLGNRATWRGFPSR